MQKRAKALQLDLALASPPEREQLALDLGAPEKGPALTYHLRRTTRKNLTVHREGDTLQVSAPRHLSLPQIEKTLRTHREVSKPPAPKPRQDWRAGAAFACLGQTLTIRLGGVNPPTLTQRELHLPLGEDASPERIRDSVHGWLQGEARRVFEATLAACAQKYGCPVPPWRLSFSAKPGASTKDGALRINWQLITQPPALIETTLTQALLTLHPGLDEGSLWNE